MGEIEFYGAKTGSIIKNGSLDNTIIYPIPALDIVHLKNIQGVTSVSIIGMDGKKMLDKSISGKESDIDISSIAKGSYMLVLKGEKVYESRLLIISH